MSQRKTIDARGAFCPGPLMEVIAALKLIEIGDEVEVWSTDQGTVKDLPIWVDKVGHKLIETNECDGYWSLVVEKTK
ncbi:MAG: sulfurtransferase TusA family protein [Alphaproteobacteria bacterium]|nr:sulfurtransferase TusA family protein [Rhodospirillales bacterium]MCW9045040.1 sulfurtransferase TusA family protein [Alphaproteobacteria bacterium]